jgi:putative NAD dependent epimerase
LEDGRAVDNRYIISDGDVYTDIEFSNLVKELLGVKTVVNLRTPMPILWCICQLGGLWSRWTNRATPLNPDKYPLMKQRSWRCDISPLMALGWKPRYRLREGLEEAIDWGRKQGLL